MTPILPQQHTLDVLSDAEHYNQWIFDTFAPWVKGTVLEIGCGTGTFTQRLLRLADHVTAVDLNESLVGIAGQRAPKARVFCANVFEAPHLLNPPYQTVVLFNVLEHLADDAEALAQIKNWLAPGGHLLLWVPALPALKSPFDRDIGHYRRYEKAPLQALLTHQGFSVKLLHYQNTLGILGWWGRFCMLRRRQFSPGSTRVFNALVPWLRLLEDRWPPPVGLSLLAVAERIT
jgi:2-polyprenyl-3-methyl-5-hydroxy-6-metoxy-1,4-benzoquinol methylase